jgi:large subunit ribosomal protein L11
MKQKTVGKEIVKTIKLYLPAQNPTANTMLNPTLGQSGVNSSEFVKKFTEMSKIYKLNIILRVRVYVFSDKTFEIVLGLPSLSYILNEEMLKFSGLKSLSEDNIIFGTKIALSSVYKIAFFLKQFGFSGNMKSIVSLLLGTLKSMHCLVINDL